MTLVYKKGEKLPNAWEFAMNETTRRRANVYDGSGGYKLQLADVAREASTSSKYDPDQLTVFEFQDILEQNKTDMAEMYSQMRNHPNFYHDLYMQMYDDNFEPQMQRFKPATLAAMYHRVNTMYDELLLDKMGQCLDKGYFSVNDKMVDVQDILEANMPRIGDIKWDDLEVYDYVDSLNREARSNVEDLVYNRQEIAYRGVRIPLREHNKNVVAVTDKICESLEPYQLQPGEDLEQVKYSMNKKYYDIKNEPVFNPRTVRQELKMNRRYSIALDGSMDNSGSRYKDPMTLDL